MRNYGAAMKLLLGSCVVYVVMAACSSGSTGGGGAISNADAQPSGNCGTCTVTGPIQATATTADTDPTRLVSGGGTLNEATAEAATGPFVLTDVTTDGILQVGIVPATASCDAFTAFARVSTAQSSGPGNGAIYGARIFVPAGEKLCVRHPTGYQGPVGYRWSGFKPYGT
jgi:hypothetical protein